MHQIPALTSAMSPWEGLYLEHHLDQRVDYQEVVLSQPSLFLQLTPGEGIEVRVGAGPSVSRQALPGDVTILPAMTTIAGSAQRSGEFLYVSIAARYSVGAALPESDPDRAEIAPRHAIQEPLVRATLAALHAEAQAGYPGGRHYGEALYTLLKTHLARHHAGLRARGGAGTLTPASVRRVADHVEAHLGRALPLTELAALVNLSPFHFARTFKRSTGLAPHQFVVRRRLERARELLVRAHVSVADVARVVGFADQSHLSAHFKRAFGITPAAFARQASRG